MIATGPFPDERQESTEVSQACFCDILRRCWQLRLPTVLAGSVAVGRSVSSGTSFEGNSSAFSLFLQVELSPNKNI
jgi:hypothetical protein